MGTHDAPLQLLLVEDDPADTSLVIQQLERSEVCPYVLRVATSVSDAEVAVVHDPVDCILLDLSLPDSEGISSVDRIHRLAPELPVIVLTGRDETAIALEAIEAGAQDVLVKGVVRGDSILRCARWAVARGRVTGASATRRERWLVEAGRAEPAPSILDRVDLPFMQLDKGMAIQYANSSFEALLGHSEAELSVAPFTELLVDDVDPLIATVLEIRSVLKPDQRAKLVEVTLRHRGGHLVPCILVVSRVQPDDEEPVLLVAALTDTQIT